MNAVSKVLMVALTALMFVLTGCTYHTTIDNSVIDQSDVTQVLGCATDFGLLDD